MSHLPADIERQLLQAFRRAYREVAAYRELCQGQGFEPGQVADAASFSRHCPLLCRANTFDRHPLAALCAGGLPEDLAQVLTSSGHGGNGRFSFGLTGRGQAAASEQAIDDALDGLFQVRSQRTLLINCLPMGVVFSSRLVTVANTSVREDMAVALVEAFGDHYGQILLVADPLFLKRLLDHAKARALDWRRHKVNVILGEEVFGENYRRYVEASLCMGEGQRVLASMGVAELGLNLCFETPALVGLRRAASANPALARELFAADPARTALPMLYAFDPRRLYLEALGQDADGYGAMTASLLDDTLPLPLLRYQTGDVIRLLRAGEVDAAASRHGASLPGGLPPSLLALQGRQGEALPNGSHAGFYKDALYAAPPIADALTGAFRLEFSASGLAWHVQLGRFAPEADGLHQPLMNAIPTPGLRPDRLVLWPYAEFPHGMGLDYERKFTYYVA